MDNYLLMKKSGEALELSRKLGFQHTLFLGDGFVLLDASTPKKLLDEIAQAKKQKKMVIFKPATEEILRFAAEKTAVDIVIGLEEIHARDSLHYVRGGLNEVLGPLLREKGVAFSVTALLQNEHRVERLTRMRFNLKLCQKYKIPVIWSTFATELWEMRAVKDIEALRRVVEKG